MSKPVLLNTDHIVEDLPISGWEYCIIGYIDHNTIRRSIDEGHLDKKVMKNIQGGLKVSYVGTEKQCRDNIKRIHDRESHLAHYIVDFGKWITLYKNPSDTEASEVEYGSSQLNNLMHTLKDEQEKQDAMYANRKEQMKHFSQNPEQTKTENMRAKLAKKAEKLRNKKENNLLSSNKKELEKEIKCEPVSVKDIEAMKLDKEMKLNKTKFTEKEFEEAAKKVGTTTDKAIETDVSSLLDDLNQTKKETGNLNKEDINSIINNLSSEFDRNKN
jgi:hypothetical protein